MKNPVLDSLYRHRSIRSYTSEPVSDKDLASVIAAVQAAPNWVNLQLVSIIAVRDERRRELLARLCGNQPHIAAAPVFLVFCADYYRVALACQKKGQSLDVVLRDMDTILVGAHEAGIALEAAVVAAESLGLGTVPIGDVRLRASELVRELALPKLVFPMLGLCVGHPAEDPGPKPRLPREAVFFEETYNPNVSARIDAYDTLYAVYLKKRPWSDRVGNWSELAADFYKTPFHYPEVPSPCGNRDLPAPNRSAKFFHEQKAGKNIFLHVFFA